ncbi:ATP-binding protein, partial [Trichocoleus desertorum AS-A10]|uniref:sensor histidine kinase n=1 Tax=Trichocoleus desertorum TaxID=1481672 RepID=UPI003299629E
QTTPVLSTVLALLGFSDVSTIAALLKLEQLFVKMRIADAQASVFHAQPSVPSITIRTEQVDQHHVSIQVCDNGSGMSPDVQAKLFDPFFTTKSIGKGTGLGLSICYQIIEKHRGKIKVISEVGRGTKFVILLPLQGV